jgi:hypothetical protein
MILTKSVPAWVHTVLTKCRGTRLIPCLIDGQYGLTGMSLLGSKSSTWQATEDENLSIDRVGKRKERSKLNNFVGKTWLYFERPPCL